MVGDQRVKTSDMDFGLFYSLSRILTITPDFASTDVFFHSRSKANIPGLTDRTCRLPRSQAMRGGKDMHVGLHMGTDDAYNEVRHLDLPGPARLYESHQL